MSGGPIRIAIVGVGKIARDQHLPAIAANPDFALVATVSSSGGVEGVPNFAQVEALIASEIEVDAISICTPPQVRTPIAFPAIDAGLDVMLEKPPASTLSAFQAMRDRAEAKGVVLFATWHSREAPMVAEAKAWLAGRTIRSGRIVWKEDVRKWHPGQAWLWQPGGLGVFDTTINALSILTEILPVPISVASAAFDVPENAHTPIAARLALDAGGAAIEADLDFLQTGDPTWDMELDTEDGILRLANGGSRLSVDGGEWRTAPEREYPGLYARFAKLVAARRRDADARPLQLVADAFLVAELRRVAPFIE